jgi:HlyD family secretion protein
MNRKRLVCIIIVAVLSGCTLLLFGPKKNKEDRFRTYLIQEGDLVVNVSATGTIEPEEVIDVGAQVAGQIISLGKDRNGNPIDYGSVIEKGMVLARIDEALYAAQLKKIQEEVTYAKADILRVTCEQELLKVKWLQAKNEWARAKKLWNGQAISKASYDKYKTDFNIAEANLSIGNASIVQSRALLAKNEAFLNHATINLGYCTITSPVDGIVIDRRVDIGQTIVANLNAPSLFLLAKDLNKMQIWVTVNEADILKIKKGQHVSFEVDAMPGEKFAGMVDKIRLNASMTQNVVTYDVEVNIDNSDGRLIPYLTANVDFEINKHKNILKVLNSALSWKPTIKQVTPEFRDTIEMINEDVIWVQEGQSVSPLKINKGLTDGVYTEVAGKSVAKGLKVVCGMQPPPQKFGKGSRQKANPFRVNLPAPPGGQGP